MEYAGRATSATDNAPEWHLNMHSLTNDYRDLQVINLDPRTADQGPYLVIQSGTAPADPEFRESLFVLRPDGKWADINAYLCRGSLDGLAEVIFPNLPAVRELLDRLPVEAEVANLPVDDAGLAAFLAANPPGTTRQYLRRWAQAYEARLKAERTGG